MTNRVTRVLFAAVVVGGLVGGLAPAQESPDPDGPIVVRNSYWAKEGLEEEVYRHRLYASSVRAELGLYSGRVLRRVSESDSQPDVVWECEYPSLEARRKDLEALDASGRFGPVTEKMSSLIERFDRTVWRATESAGE